jgi:hypothetical protein
MFVIPPDISVDVECLRGSKKPFFSWTKCKATEETNYFDILV